MPSCKVRLSIPGNIIYRLLEWILWVDDTFILLIGTNGEECFKMQRRSLEFRFPQNYFEIQREKEKKIGLILSKLSIIVLILL